MCMICALIVVEHKPEYRRTRGMNCSSNRKEISQSIRNAWKLMIKESQRNTMKRHRFRFGNMHIARMGRVFREHSGDWRATAASERQNEYLMKMQSTSSNQNEHLEFKFYLKLKITHDHDRHTTKYRRNDIAAVHTTLLQLDVLTLRKMDSSWQWWEEWWQRCNRICATLKWSVGTISMHIHLHRAMCRWRSVWQQILCLCRKGARKNKVTRKTVGETTRTEKWWQNGIEHEKIDEQKEQIETRIETLAVSWFDRCCEAKTQPLLLSSSTSMGDGNRNTFRSFAILLQHHGHRDKIQRIQNARYFQKEIFVFNLLIRSDDDDDEVANSNLV